MTETPQPSSEYLTRSLDVLVEYLKGNFEVQLPVEDPSNVLDGLHAAINVTGEELESQQQLREKAHHELEIRVKELEEAMAHIKTLQGLIPICMYCHKIRNDQESWQRIEDYLSQNTDIQLSHSLCPDCLEKHFPEEEE